MKKRIAVLLALMIGFVYCPSETVVMAAGNEEKLAEMDESDEKSLDQDGESSCLSNLFGTFFGGKENEALDENAEKEQDTLNKKSSVPETSGPKNLQIPQKLNVVIDPWEMDKKGQVYSEEYTISNTGDSPGILTLSNLACRPRDKSGVIVRTEKSGIHDSGDKSIFMEMVLGSGERIVFSQENSQYQIELQPGEELSLCFTGEVNENAFGQWENDDIAVSVVYAWETEEEINSRAAEVPEEENTNDVNIEEAEEKTQDEPDSEDKENPDTDSEETIEKTEDVSADEEPEAQQSEDTETETDNDQPDDVNTESSQDIFSDDILEEREEAEEPGSINNSDDSLNGDNTEAVMEESVVSNEDVDSAEIEKDEIKNIELQEPQKVDVVIDSWKTDEKGRIVSPQYLLENTGDTAGVWILSDLICKPLEDNVIAVKTDKSELHDSEERYVYMELLTGNGEKIILSQEKSQYKVELKPGEKLEVRFVGEMTGNLFENNEDGDIAVTAVCTWELK